MKHRQDPPQLKIRPGLFVIWLGFVLTAAFLLVAVAQ